MKKAIKKLMAALLAVAMLCALAVPAFADGTGSASNPGSITIGNAVKGQNYKIYRILDLETNGTGTDSNSYTAFKYKPNGQWKSFIEAHLDDFAIDSDGYVTWINSNTNDDSATIQAIANAARTYADTNTISADATATGDSPTVSGLPLGYYLVVSDLNNGAICSLGTTKPNVTINEKNGKPTIDKEIVEGDDEVKANDVNIGDYVKFKTTVKVIDGKPYKYSISDTMDAGLTFVEDVAHPFSVTVNNHSNDSLYDKSVNTDGHGFVITFHDIGTESVLKTNDEVVITYYAQVNANAVIGTTGNTNHAELKYGNKTETSSTTTYVWDFGVHKFTTSGSSDNIPLEGAVFKLYKKNATDGTKSYATLNNVAAGGDSAAAEYKLVNWTASADTATTFTTPKSGNIHIEGLDAGTYYLEEVTAPEGYNKLAADIEVIITSVMPTSPSGTVSYSVSYRNAGSTASAENAAANQVPVLNNAGTTLPGTGGIGTTIFYVVGGGLMVAAAVLLITKKRMENKN